MSPRPPVWTAGGGDAVADRVAPCGGRCPGLGGQVVPGAVEEFAGDDAVFAVRNEDRNTGQVRGVRRHSCLEGQGAAENRGTGVQCLAPEASTLVGAAGRT